MMAKSYTVHGAHPDHLFHLADIERRAARLFPEGVLPAATLEEAVPLETLRLAEREGRLWVAIAEACGEPVGFALLEIADGVASLAELDVLPEHGGRGVGRALVARAADRARELGHRHLWLTTFRDIPWNAPFYRKIGFAMVDAEIPRPVREALAVQAAAGLRDRVAMRLSLAETPNRE